MIVGHSLFQYASSDVGRFIYAFHMPLFFILSGYLYREKTYENEMKSAVKNLLLPYFSTAIITIGIFLLAKFDSPWLVHNYPASINDLMSSIFYGIGVGSKLPFPAYIYPIGALWFLMAMTVALQLFNLIIVKTTHVKSKGLVRAFIIGLLAIIGKLVANFWLLPLSTNAALFALVFLYVGYLMRKENFLETLSLKIIFICLLGWTIAASNQMFQLAMVQSPDSLLAVLGAVGGSVVIIRLSQWLATKNVMVMILAPIGRLSIIVLCFHNIDLTYSQVPTMIMSATFTQNIIVKIVLINIYRLIIPMLALLLIPRTPILKSLYLNRQFPFFKSKSRKIKKNNKLDLE